MKTIKIWNDNPAQNQIDEIVEALREGAVIVMPTDTLYAVAADALSVKAVEKVCRIKGLNPEKNTLSIICSDISQAAEYSKIDNSVFKLLKRFTPGPFTFLLKAAGKLPRAFKARKIVGIRIPDNAICTRIAEALGNPLITTSIEYDDEDYAISPTLIAEHYENKVDMMIEGEDGSVVPSTVVDLSEGSAEILRQGAGEFDL